MLPRWYQRNAIPNLEGYKLIVFLTDGTEVLTEVVRVEGIHVLKDTSISTVKAWRKL